MTIPDIPMIPENGFSPEDFPQVTVAQIPYSSSTGIRPDPLATIGADDWLLIDVGTIRIAIPDRVQWSKLVYMIEALWNTHERSQQQEESNNDSDSADDQGQRGEDMSPLDPHRALHALASPPETNAHGSVPEPTDGGLGDRH